MAVMSTNTEIGAQRRVVVLGATGSVGTQALDVIAARPERFTVAGLAAGGADVASLAAQARAHRVPRVAVADPAAARELRRALPGVDVLAGPDAATELTATTPADTVLNAVTGSRGLGPTLAALGSGATLALANKESLVAGGPLVTRAAAPGQIVPVDSEHSALAQCLRGGREQEVARLVLTASGGPFRGRTRAELADVTPAQAFAHPTWSMGPVVTINSATLVNKGLELIEAHLLFGVPYDRIDVVVHPQSVVHSMVTFTDGSTLAQASPPDMRLPIALALGWPERVAGAAAACTWDLAQAWTFEPLDDDTFAGVRLARRVGAAGGCLPAVFNAANEEAVAAFVAGALGFLDITAVVEDTLAAADDWRADPATAADVAAAEEWARAHARSGVTAAAR
jgi:1-deoxy-D-xylulose-5-phosphate reductoisomerase